VKLDLKNMTPRLPLSIAPLLLLLLCGPILAQTPAPAVFQRLDKNGDGKITADETPNAQALQRYDLDKDGAITLDEYNRASAAPATPPSTPPAAPMTPPGTPPVTPPTTPPGAGRPAGAQGASRILELDKNTDGKITKEEAGGAPWFDRVDGNKDGVLDAAELAKLPGAAPRPPGTPMTPPGTPPATPPTTPPGTNRPMQGGGQTGAMIQQLDKNADGQITKEEAGGAAWFDRVDGNKDGVLDKVELDALRNRSGGGTPPGPRPAPNPPAPPSTPAAPPKGAADGFVPDAPFVGEVGGSYIDPEFSESASQVVFQDMQNRVWIGDIDPATGFFKTTGRDHLMDENIVVVFDRPPQGRKFSTNGPEWTRDEKGHLVVYTKEDAAGIMQQWAARLVDGKSVVTQLTRQKYDCYGNMPSRFQDGKPPRVAYTHDWPIWKAKAAWVFLDQGDAPRELENFNYKQMSMWSAVSPHFLFVQQPEGAPIGQVAVSDADTGAVRVLTDDAGMKDDPGMFLAPEFGGELLLVCNVDNSALAIYRDEAKDGKTPWKRIATLTLPEDAPYKFISSPETIASATGVGGVSYFSLLARENKERTSRGSIWVLGLGTDEKNRLARRVDDGASPSVLEPEPFVGKNEVYVYYNAFDGASRKSGLRRAATGIKVGEAAKSGASPSSAAPAANTKTSWDGAKVVVECLAADLDTTARFYRDGLGLKEIVSTGESRVFQYGDAFLRLRPASQPKPASTGAPLQQTTAANGIRYLSIVVRDLKAAEDRLVKAGFPKPQTSQYVSLLSSPDGYLVELIGVPSRGEQIIAGIVVSDETAARKFYGEQLAFTFTESKPLPRSWGSRQMHYYDAGSAHVKLGQPDGTRTAALAGAPGIAGLTMLVADVTGVSTHLASRGLKAGDSAGFSDPDGNRIAIAAVDSIFQKLAAAVSTPPSSPTGTAPARQGASRILELDKNGDGRITKEEAGAAPWFARVDGNSDGVLDAAELARLRGGAPSTPPPPPAPAPQTTTQPSSISGPTLFRRTELAGLSDSPVAVNGFAIADLNRDGLPDLVATRQLRTTFFVRPGAEFPHDRLDVLLNRGGMKFEPHTITITGSDLTPEKFGLSAEVPNLADFNGDGFLDLFITRSGGAKQQKHGNTLLLSDGAWDKFRDMSAAMGVQNLDGYNRQSSIADVNGDGFLDIAIGCDSIGRPDRYGSPHSRLFVFQPAAKSFTDIAGTLGLDGFGGYTGDPAKDKAGPGIALRDLDNDGDLDLVQTFHADMTGAAQNEREAAANYAQGVWVWKNLLRENGRFGFQRVTDNGLAEVAKLRWNAEKRFYEAASHGTGLPYFALADTDNDSLLDMLAIGPNSTYWAPRADYTGGRFWKNLGGFRFERATESVGFASLDWNYKQLYEHNGWPISAAMANTAPRPAAGRDHKQPGLPSFGPGGNYPYFADVIFADFDNDGWQDVICLDRAELPGLQTYALYYRNERGTFRLLKSAETGLDAGGISGEAADLNGDGLLDLVFAADPMNSAPGQKPDPDRLQSKAFLHTGEHGAKANHWLHLTFTGLKDAELIGAHVELTADGKTQHRWIHTNHSYKSGGALEAHFGLGQATSAEVKVTLLNGTTKSFAAIAADKSHKLSLDTP
jgi:catechol 2,3-dioxygenase-like lactoylglutathione lyase family enzyme